MGHSRHVCHGVMRILGSETHHVRCLIRYRLENHEGVTKGLIDTLMEFMKKMKMCVPKLWTGRMGDEAKKPTL